MPRPVSAARPRASSACGWRAQALRLEPQDRSPRLRWSAWRSRRRSTGSVSRRSRPGTGHASRGRSRGPAGPERGLCARPSPTARPSWPPPRPRRWAGHRSPPPSPAAAIPIRWSRRSRRPAPALQFAAARALVDHGPDPALPRLQPGRSHPGPVRDAHQSLPRAVVIDGNPTRGSQLAGFLEPGLRDRPGDRPAIRASLPPRRPRTSSSSWSATTCPRSLGLDRHPDQPQDRRPDRELAGLMSTARSTSRSSGPACGETSRGSSSWSSRSTGHAGEAAGGRPARLSDAERAGYAREAAALLARIASQPKSPLAADLTAAEPALAVALSQPGTSLAASTALGDVPEPDRPAEPRRRGP